MSGLGQDAPGPGEDVIDAVVSVVVPAFNADVTLERCLRSVLSQHHLQLDVIVVDDGSTDTTRVIAEAHAAQDLRVRLVSQENSGLSEARNTGIRAARGAWITFLDADDWVEPDYLSAALGAAARTGASVAVVGFSVDFEDASGAVTHQTSKLPGTAERLVSSLPRSEVDADFVGLLGYAWNKLYRLAPDPNDRFSFEPGLRLIEDMEFQSRVMPDADAVVLCPRALVHYVQPSDGISLGRNFSPDFLDLRLRWLDCARSLVRRWGLGDSAQDPLFVGMAASIAHEAQRRAWEAGMMTGLRWRLLLTQLQHPEVGRLGRGAATTRGVPAKQRSIGLALWVLSFLARIPLASTDVSVAAERSGPASNVNEEHPGAPMVSVIMGVYNAENTLREAVNSILAQSFEDWELILCDDSSSDGSLALCQEYASTHPVRIRVLKNAVNLKLAATLNRCLGEAQGSLIARMDADDISTPDRLARQVELLGARPEIDLVGTAMRRFNESGLGGVVMPTTHPDRTTLRNATPFNHATIVARRHVFDALGGYEESPRAERCEDYDLWFRFFAHGYSGLNLAEPLYLVREDANAFRRRTPRGRLNEYRTAINGFRMLGYPPHWYVCPTLQLAKALVPPAALQRYRQCQDWFGKRAR